MSDSEAERADLSERQALSLLEAAVGRLLADRAELDARVREAEARLSELEALLRKFQDGTSDPVALQSALSRAKAENRTLRARLNTGREGVDRLLARLRFTEDRS